MYMMYEEGLAGEAHSKRYGDGAGNTVEENSSVFSLIRMGGRKGIRPVKNGG